MTIRVHQILLFCGISSVFWCFYAFFSLLPLRFFPPCFSFLIILHPPKRVISTEDQTDSAFSGVQRTRGL